MRQDLYLVKKTALTLFGDIGRMEAPEDRLMIAHILSRSADERLQRLSRLLLDDKDLMGQKVSLAAQAVACGVTDVEISNAFVKAIKAEGFIRQAKHLPDLMEQAAIDAKSRWEDCKHCGGAGSIGDKVCERCSGKGEVYVLGDTSRLKMVFETYGLTAKSGAVNILNVASPPSSSETLPALAGSLSSIIEGNK